MSTSGDSAVVQVPKDLLDNLIYLAHSGAVCLTESYQWHCEECGAKYEEYERLEHESGCCIRKASELLRESIE